MVTIIEHAKPRRLDDPDYRLMGLPANTWGARLSLVHPSVLPAVKSYLEKRKTVMEKGWGLLLHGPKGSGKTSIAAGILKTFNAYGYSAFFVTPMLLKDAQLHQTMFSDECSVLKKCMEVHILCIDDVTPENGRDPIYGAAAMAQLVRHRRDWGRPTLITTPVDMKSLDDRRGIGQLFDIHGAWATVHVPGGNNPNDIEKEILGGKK